jgi:drug/metabolite transporter (DMT)-like permease
VLVTSLVLQSVMLGAWLAWRDRAAFMGSVREWRRSFGAGFLSASASALWMCAFALTAVANTRTLALIELPMAALMAHRMTGKRPTGQQWLGILIVLAGWPC